jgi:AcrR family transcriptional regulator
MSDDTAVEGSTGTLRDAAVARSLDPARARAEKRVQRFLDAALELMADSSNKEFTVQQVVERSGQSLRSFYQYFAGKYELLLALFEESVRSTAVHLEDAVEGEPDALERLHVFAIEYYRICQPVPKGKVSKSGPTPAMAEFAQQLLTEHPKEAAHAFVPLVSLLERLLEDATAAGALRPGLDHQRVAGMVLQAIMFHSFAATISGATTRTDGQELWDLVLHGFGSP